jgi:hypothetical protein
VGSPLGLGLIRFFGHRTKGGYDGTHDIWIEAAKGSA